MPSAAALASSSSAQCAASWRGQMRGRVVRAAQRGRDQQREDGGVDGGGALRVAVVGRDEALPPAGAEHGRGQGGLVGGSLCGGRDGVLRGELWQRGVCGVGHGGHQQHQRRMARHSHTRGSCGAHGRRGVDVGGAHALDGLRELTRELGGSERGLDLRHGNADAVGAHERELGVSVRRVEEPLQDVHAGALIMRTHAREVCCDVCVVLRVGGVLVHVHILHLEARQHHAGGERERGVEDDLWGGRKTSKS